MATLIRLLVLLVILGVFAFLAMLALAYLVPPGHRQMIIEIPVERLGQ
jgi:hypothetical protein